MRKSGPLNDALHHIVELDKQLASISSQAVVAWNDAGNFRRLKRERRDYVRQLQTAPRG